jgi:hypothetical protein
VLPLGVGEDAGLFVVSGCGCHRCGIGGIGNGLSTSIIADGMLLLMALLVAPTGDGLVGASEE